MDLTDIFQLQAFAVTFLKLSVAEFENMLPFQLAEHQRYGELYERLEREHSQKIGRYISYNALVGPHADPKALPKSPLDLFRLPSEEEQYQKEMEEWENEMKDYDGWLQQPDIKITP